VKYILELSGPEIVLLRQQLSRDPTHTYPGIDAPVRDNIIDKINAATRSPEPTAESAEEMTPQTVVHHHYHITVQEPAGPEDNRGVLRRMAHLGATERMDDWKRGLGH
jgi:hypothetical protein